MWRIFYRCAGITRFKGNRALGTIMALNSLNKRNNLMATKNHGKQIKNDRKYEALKSEGMSKEKAARIANTPKSGKKGGKAGKYEDRPKQDLYQKAKEVGIQGRSKMSKKELINSLRNH